MNNLHLETRVSKIFLVFVCDFSVIKLKNKRLQKMVIMYIYFETTLLIAKIINLIFL